MQEWYDFTPTGPIRNWPSNGVNPDPFHAGEKASLRGVIPDGDSPTMLKIDLAHTYAIAGFGKDELASTLVFVAVRCRTFGETNIPSQLNAAYDSFDQWCKNNKKTSTIKSFDLEELKIKSLLNRVPSKYFCKFTALKT